MQRLCSRSTLFGTCVNIKATLCERILLLANTLFLFHKGQNMWVIGACIAVIAECVSPSFYGRRQKPGSIFYSRICLWNFPYQIAGATTGVIWITAFFCARPLRDPAVVQGISEHTLTFVKLDPLAIAVIDEYSVARLYIISFSCQSLFTPRCLFTHCTYAIMCANGFYILINGKN